MVTLFRKGLPGSRSFITRWQASFVNMGDGLVAVVNAVQVLAADPRRWPFIKGLRSARGGI